MSPTGTEDKIRPLISIGMATYDDFDGVYFTIQSIRLHNKDLADKFEFIVVDNNPESNSGRATREFCKQVPCCKYVKVRGISSTAIRNRVFEIAEAEIVLCVDCHVLVEPDGLRGLLSYFEQNPLSLELLQGPMLYDNCQGISSHWDPVWRNGMFGTWASDPRADDVEGAAFEIPMQGLGLFACRRSSWPGFNPAFRGFGGEEGYIHEKIRQRGGRVMCLPALRWMHRFGRPSGPPYPISWYQRIRNYIVGFSELNLPVEPIEIHFRDFLKDDIANVEKVIQSSKHEALYSSFEAFLASRPVFQWHYPSGPYQ